MTLLAVLLILGCAADPGWSRESVLAGPLARMDADQDGRVGGADYLRYQGAGAPLTTADADGDGQLSAAELVEILIASDPLAGGPSEVRRAPNDASMRATYPRTWDQRMAAERSLFTREALAAGGQMDGWPAPSDAVEAHDGTGSPVPGSVP